MSRPELPGYVLTVITRDLTDRRARWSRERAHGRPRPQITEWHPTPLDDPQVGLLVAVDGYGEVTRTAPCDTPQGILAVPDGYLIARHNVIELWSRELAYQRDHASLPWFNDVHSLRASDQGVVIAASGTDTVTEISPTGELRWTWWGAEHGFDTDTFGSRRVLDPAADHRGIVYDTWLQATHVNSAMALGEDTVLATLFHQNSLACIDRHTGDTRPLLEGLARPHAIRRQGGMLTLADTAHGVGLVARVHKEDSPADCQVEVEQRVAVSTNWLQDWQALPDGIFVAVDGERPAVVFLTADGEVIRRDEFEPSWYLYEVELD